MKRTLKKELLQIFAITVGGLFLFNLSLMMYQAIYFLVEYAYYESNPMNVPVGLLRFGGSLILVIAYLFVIRLKLSEIVKSTLLIAPVSMVSISMMMMLYEHSVLLILADFILIGLSKSIVYFLKKPWFYLYASFYAIVLGIVYTFL
ncbi:MAG: hypothetical protein AB7U79_04330 [Candidatus Izemoplasmatales bacterium]